MLSDPQFKLRLAAGQVFGARAFTKFGKNGDIGTGTVPEEIWNGGGLRYYPTAAATTYVASTSANDTGGGTGARTLRIIGLDANWNPITEDVTLNGTTPVQLSNEFLRADRAYSLTVGSLGWNEGDIDIYHGNATTEKMVDMPAERNQTAIASYTVPANHTLFLDRVVFCLLRNNNAEAEIILELQENAPTSERPNLWHAATYFGLRGSGTSNHTVLLPQNYFAIPGCTDIRQKIIYCSSNSTSINCNMGGVLVDHSKFSF